MRVKQNNNKKEQEFATKWHKILAYPMTAFLTGASNEDSDQPVIVYCLPVVALDFRLYTEWSVKTDQAAQTSAYCLVVRCAEVLVVRCAEVLVVRCAEVLVVRCAEVHVLM